MTIYEYFGYPRKIIELTFKGMTYNPLKDNFKKRWGENLERDSDSLAFTKQDYSDFSNRFEKIFKTNLALVLEYYNMGYSENEIVSALKRKEKLRLRLPVFKSTDEMLSVLSINKEQLIKFLDKQKSTSSLCFQYYYGFNHPKLDIVSISKLLNIEVNNVVKNIYLIYKNLIKEQKLEKKILRDNTNPIALERRRKSNYLEYFNDQDKKYVLEILEQEKIANTKRYQALMKIYSEDYILKEHPETLTQNEYVNIWNLRKIILRELELIKSGEKSFQRLYKRKRIINYLDFFDEQDRKYVLEILEQEKINNTKRYQALMKIYSEDYILKENPETLTKNECVYFSTLKKIIQKKVDKIKNNRNTCHEAKKIKRKINYLDYFNEQDKKYVLEILEQEKITNTKAYQALMKVYSEDYILKENPDELTKNEYVNISNLKRRIQNRLDKIKNNETISHEVKKIKRKINYLDYFEEQDKKYVLEALEMERISNTKRYQTLMKIYDEKYILRDNPEKLDKNDNQKFCLLIKAINKKVKRLKEVEIMIECQKEKIRIKRQQKHDAIDLSNMSVYEMDKYYLENLELFKENYPLILFTILKHGNFTVKEIIEKSSLKNYMELMTDMEKAYFYLKLKSCQDNSLTDEKIEQILDLTKQDLEEYELNTKSDFLNKMNVLIKPSK